MTKMKKKNILLASNERPQNVYLCWIKYTQTLPSLIRSLSLYLKISPTANLSQELKQGNFKILIIFKMIFTRCFMPLFDAWCLGTAYEARLALSYTALHGLGAYSGFWWGGRQNIYSVWSDTLRLTAMTTAHWGLSLIKSTAPLWLVFPLVKSFSLHCNDTSWW